MNSADREPFQLSDDFIATFARRQPDWGPIGYITYKRTYARDIETSALRVRELARLHDLSGSEEFWLTATRVVEGVFRTQQRHCLHLGLPWSNAKAQGSAQDMFQRWWDFKWSPPGRGIWMMGTEYVERAGGACLNNCGFSSTAQIDSAFSAPFAFLMDMSMLGVGVGGDTEGAGKMEVQAPVVANDTHRVPDTRQGWVDLIRRILDAYAGAATLPRDVDYSQIRAAGVAIKGFGGTASGPAPLQDLVASVHQILGPLIGQRITSTAIVDLFNVIGRCVVAGNVRRSAEIMFGRADDAEFSALKDPTEVQALEDEFTRLVQEHAPNDVKELVARRIAGHPLRTHRWASNNSVLARVGMDYRAHAANTARNGEPGYLWLDNARQFSRMGDAPDGRDIKVAGSNPCVEQSLESFELCCLVESFPAAHDSYADYERTLKTAYMYAKTVTLVPTHDPRTNAVALRNRRIGTSASGLVQAMNRHGRRTIFNWLDHGYAYLRRMDGIYSDWLCVPRSIKITSVKPSGTVSLLNGATPGMHFPHAPYYLRVIRFDSMSPLVRALRAAGYRCEEVDPAREPNTTAVYFPVAERLYRRGKRDVSMWEQLEIAAQLQAHWADNQVSCTVTFRPEEAKDIQYALELYETRLKGISFLPLPDDEAEYARLGFLHPPYQACDEATYHECERRLRPLDLSGRAVHDTQEVGCDGATCVIAR